jgi:hypothetical protein
VALSEARIAASETAVAPSQAGVTLPNGSAVSAVAPQTTVAATARVRHPMDTWLTERPRTILLGLAGIGAAALAGVLAVSNLEMAVGLVLGLALVVTVLVRPFIGGMILVAGVPVLSGLLAGMPIPHVRVSEALIGAVGLTVILSARRRDAVAWEPLDWALLVYGLGWLGFAAVNAVSLHQSLGLTGWGTAFGQLQFFLLYRGVRVSLRTTAERRLGMKVLLIASVLVVALAVLQQVHAPGVADFIIKITGGPDQSGATSTITRSTGPFANWAALAGYVLPIVVVLVAFAFAGVTHRRRWAAFALTAFAVLGLLITAELSALTCVIIGVIVLGVQYGQFRRVIRWLGISAVVLVVVLGPFLAGRLTQQFGQNAAHHSAVPQTIGFRGQVWTRQYIPAIEERPLDGYGGQLPASISWPYPESQYIAELIEGGVPLLVLFVVLMWAMVAQGRKLARAPDPYDVAVGRALVIVVVSLIAMDVVWPYVSNGGMPQVLWCMFGLVSPLGARVGAR